MRHSHESDGGPVTKDLIGAEVDVGDGVDSHNLWCRSWSWTNHNLAYSYHLIRCSQRVDIAQRSVKSGARPRARPFVPHVKMIDFN